MTAQFHAAVGAIVVFIIVIIALIGLSIWMYQTKKKLEKQVQKANAKSARRTASANKRANNVDQTSVKQKTGTGNPTPVNGQVDNGNVPPVPVEMDAEAMNNQNRHQQAQAQPVQPLSQNPVADETNVALDMDRTTFGVENENTNSNIHNRQSGTSEQQAPAGNGNPPSANGQVGIGSVQPNPVGNNRQMGSAVENNQEGLQAQAQPMERVPRNPVEGDNVHDVTGVTDRRTILMVKNENTNSNSHNRQSGSPGNLGKKYDEEQANQNRQVNAMRTPQNINSNNSCGENADAYINGDSVDFDYCETSSLLNKLENEKEIQEPTLKFEDGRKVTYKPSVNTDQIRSSKIKSASLGKTDDATHDRDLEVEELRTELKILQNEIMKLRKYGANSQNTEIPKNSTEIENKNLDDACRITERLVTSNPYEFCRHVLKLSAAESRKIENSGSVVSVKIADGFYKWKQKHGSNATVKSYIQLLREEERNDVADEIETSLKLNSKDNIQNQKNLDKAFRICEKYLDEDSAQTLFRCQMELEDHIVSKFSGSDRKTFVASGLHEWKNKLGNSATVELLLDHLRDAELQIIYDEICSQLEIDEKVQDAAVGSTPSTSSETKEKSSKKSLDAPAEERSFIHEPTDIPNKANPTQNDFTQESGSTVAETVPKSPNHDARNPDETRPKVHSDDTPTSGHGADSDLRVEPPKETTQSDEGLGIEPDENGEYMEKSNDDDVEYKDIDHNHEDPTGTSGVHDKKRKSPGEKKKKKKKTKDAHQTEGDSSEKEKLLKDGEDS